MDLSETKMKIVELRSELTQVESELKELNNINMEHQKKVTFRKNRKKELSKEINKLEDIIKLEDIYGNVLWIEGFETLTQSDLVAINKGMDKNDYREFGDYPRWIDLERIVKEVIDFKKMYPDWILESVVYWISEYDDNILPKTLYRYTYRTPQGHYEDIWKPIIKS
jgi:hypothetical protein